MENNPNVVLDADLTLLKKPKRRRDLLPWWIKTFIWIFLVMGSFSPIAIILGLLGKSFQMSLFGLSSTEPISATGLILIFIFALKWMTGFGLWTEKDWAINISQFDAITSIILCTVMIFINPFTEIISEQGVRYEFRFELVILIPYLIKISTIKPAWKNMAKVKFRNHQLDADPLQ